MERIRNAHKFFVEITPSFVGHRHTFKFNDWTNYGNEEIGQPDEYTLDFKDKLYYPIAYVKFMLASIFGFNV